MHLSICYTQTVCTQKINKQYSESLFLHWKTSTSWQVYKLWYTETDTLNQSSKEARLKQDRHFLWKPFIHPTLKSTHSLSHRGYLWTPTHTLPYLSAHIHSSSLLHTHCHSICDQSSQIFDWPLWYLLSEAKSWQVIKLQGQLSIAECKQVRKCFCCTRTKLCNAFWVHISTHSRKSI